MKLKNGRVYYRCPFCRCNLSNPVADAGLSDVCPSCKRQYQVPAFSSIEEQSAGPQRKSSRPAPPQSRHSSFWSRLRSRTLSRQQQRWIAWDAGLRQSEDNRIANPLAEINLCVQCGWIGQGAKLPARYTVGETVGLGTLATGGLFGVTCSSSAAVGVGLIILGILTIPLCGIGLLFCAAGMIMLFTGTVGAATGASVGAHGAISASRSIDSRNAARMAPRQCPLCINTSLVPATSPNGARRLQQNAVLQSAANQIADEIRREVTTRQAERKRTYPQKPRMETPILLFALPALGVLFIGASLLWGLFSSEVTPSNVNDSTTENEATFGDPIHNDKQDGINASSDPQQNARYEGLFQELSDDQRAIVERLWERNQAKPTTRLQTVPYRRVSCTEVLSTSINREELPYPELEREIALAALSVVRFWNDDPSPTQRKMQAFDGMHGQFVRFNDPYGQAYARLMNFQQVEVGFNLTHADRWANSPYDAILFYKVDDENVHIYSYHGDGSAGKDSFPVSVLRRYCR